VLVERLQIGGRSFEFIRVADPRVVLDRVIAAEAKGPPQRMPYWAEVWESAIAIGQWLVEAEGAGASGKGPAAERAQSLDARPAAQHRRFSARLSVLDLGCGMGLAGMVAAAVGHQVMFADIETDALLFAEVNAWPWRAAARFRRLNWQTDALGERFDLILGADVLYETGQWEFLEPFWRRHLAAGGTVLLGEPRRPKAETFADWISRRGWVVQSAERFLVEQGKTIRLFSLRLQ